MSKLTVLGRDFEIAPFKIGELRKAAPFIDRINEREGSMSTMAGLAESASDLIGVLSIALMKHDASLTPDYLEAQLDIGDLVKLKDAFQAQMGASGLGEAKAPSGATDGAAQA